MPAHAANLRNKGRPIYSVSVPRWVVDRIEHQVQTGSQSLCRIANDAILAYLQAGKPDVQTEDRDGHFKGRIFVLESTITAMGLREPDGMVTPQNPSPATIPAGIRVAQATLQKALTHHARSLPEVVHPPVIGLGQSALAQIARAKPHAWQRAFVAGG